MTDQHARKSQAQVLRITRKIHRTTGALLFFFFLFISLTGLLLGWKKHSGGLLLSKTYKGDSARMQDWLPMDSLHKNACRYLRDSVSPGLSAEIDRIDVRPDKGIVKFVFAGHYWGLQLDCTTGSLLHVERRNADLIENIHDGSILDNWLGTSGEHIKLVYTSIMGAALLTFTVTGFWLWYGPKRMRRANK